MFRGLSTALRIGIEEGERPIQPQAPTGSVRDHLVLVDHGSGSVRPTLERTTREVCELASPARGMESQGILVPVAEHQCLSTFSLIGRCQSKIWKEQVQEFVLTCPHWPNQPWLPLLLDMAIKELMIICQRPNLLVNRLGVAYPLSPSGALVLTAWKFSGVETLRRDFR